MAEANSKAPIASGNQLGDLETDLSVIYSQSEVLKQLETTVQGLGLSHISRHVFICTDATKPKCIDRESSLESWEYLKKRLHELKLDRPSNDHLNMVFRTKANCLRICQHGPIAVVYPDGIWYHSVTPTVVEEIIQRHLLKNEIVHEYVFAQHLLTLKSPE
jgi:(2Fe-2S) ferredoxin